MSWDDILGQDLAKRILRTHLAAGTVADAYLLTGPEGVGKRRLALEMAKALNCLGESQRPCDHCPTCGQINRGVHPDVHTVSPSGASSHISIDDVRRVLGRVGLRPFSARVQVAILDGAERLTEEAANALLKTLEEPSSRTKFLLITTEVARCLPTIISRCQLIRCQPLSLDVIQRLLVDREGCDPHVAAAAARLSRGSVSRASAFMGRWEAYEKSLKQFSDATVASWMAQPLPDTRQEVLAWLEAMLAWLRDLAVVVATGHRDGAVASTWLAHATYEDQLRRQAAAVDVDRCVETAFALMELRDSLEQFVSPRLVAALAREKWLSLTGAKHV